jgi:hypothetical protein
MTSTSGSIPETHSGSFSETVDTFRAADQAEYRAEGSGDADRASDQYQSVECPLDGPHLAGAEPRARVGWVRQALAR